MKPINYLPTEATLITVCKWVSLYYTIHCFANTTLRKRARLLTQKLDLDQMSERNMYIHTEGHIYDKTHLLLQIVGLFASYDPVRMILTIFVT